MTLTAQFTFGWRTGVVVSSFKINAKHKKSGEIHSVWCMDDYFGKHIYGYIPNVEGGQAMTFDEFEKQYETDETPWPKPPPRTTCRIL